jgi:hypothetical protein
MKYLWLLLLLSSCVTTKRIERYLEKQQSVRQIDTQRDKHTNRQIDEQTKEKDK